MNEKEFNEWFKMNKHFIDKQYRNIEAASLEKRIERENRSFRKRKLHLLRHTGEKK